MKGEVIELKDGRWVLISTYQPLVEINKIILTLVDKDFKPLLDNKRHPRTLIRSVELFKETYKDGVTLITTLE